MCEILNLGCSPVLKVWVIHVTQSRTLGRRCSGWPFPRGDSFTAEDPRINPSPWALIPFSRPVCLPGETVQCEHPHLVRNSNIVSAKTETQTGLFLSAGLPNGMIHISLCFAPSLHSLLCTQTGLLFAASVCLDRPTVCYYTTRWVA